MTHGEDISLQETVSIPSTIPNSGRNEHSSRKTVFVVGLGMVGIAFVEKLLNLDEGAHYKIVTCGEEDHLAYNRVALTEYLQHRSAEKLYLNQKDWYMKHPPSLFQFYIGETVTSIDHQSHSVKTSKGRTIAYDTCVLATGSEAALPEFAKSPSVRNIRGVFVYRNIADLDAIITYSSRGGRAIVVGGGLLGLEAAKAVHDLKSMSNVSIINRKAFPLSRQLDEDGGEIVLKRVEAMGVTVLTNTVVSGLVTSLASEARQEREALAGVRLSSTQGASDQSLECTMIIFAIGIAPRDDLARASGIACRETGGIIVNDCLETSAKDVFAIGECASWKGATYGLIGPGIEMADILSFNLTQLQTGQGLTFKARKMNNPDLSTKLKLMGVDVASFGDFLAEKRAAAHPASSIQVESAKKRTHGPSDNGPIECISYRDPFGGVYKKYIFSADGKYLLGGMMVGDTGDYIKMVALVKKKKQLDIPPSQFILGSRDGQADDSADLDDDTQICSCHGISKGLIIAAFQSGSRSLDEIKRSTKAGTGCGGCVPMATSILKAEMKKAGQIITNHLCLHFPMSRAELYSVVQLKKLKTFSEVMAAFGAKPDALGCEICKPAIGSILSSLWNEHPMHGNHHANQDTNDRFLANIQRNGTFSVIPRVPAGEITPEKLIALGQVAKKYNLYTKITGGQRIDLFGAQKQDLPDIWEMLIEAGFESGHAYGKALRTVKSCVGTNWCRYGVGDSVGLAVQLEERYKGIRSPHKLKGGVSGCVRECAEAQSKDFGVIATDKGWNIFIAGNGGANPRHATLFATDVPPSKVVRIIDRYLMYYIHTADKLTRTARWVEQFDGGIERLKKILLEDELGICNELERQMNELVGTYQCEWKAVVNSLERRKQFKQFVNTDETRPQIEIISERGQNRPADWPKAFPPVKFATSDLVVPKSNWEWCSVAKVEDLNPTEAGTTSVAVKYGDSQLAVFHIPGRGFFATQQMCPHRRAFVLDHGIIGGDKEGNPYVSCPLHKRNFSLTTGEGITDQNYSIITFDVKAENGEIRILLPDADLLDAVLGTSRWMVKQATAEALGRSATSQIEIVGPAERISNDKEAGGVDGCLSHRLEW